MSTPEEQQPAGTVGAPPTPQPGVPVVSASKPQKPAGTKKTKGYKKPPKGKFRQRKGSRLGELYKVQKSKKGNVRVYDDGDRVRVKKGKGKRPDKSGTPTLPNKAQDPKPDKLAEQVKARIAAKYGPIEKKLQEDLAVARAKADPNGSVAKAYDNYTKIVGDLGQQHVQGAQAAANITQGLSGAAVASQAGLGAANGAQAAQQAAITGQGGQAGADASAQGSDAAFAARLAAGTAGAAAHDGAALAALFEAGRQNQTAQVGVAQSQKATAMRGLDDVVAKLVQSQTDLVRDKGNDAVDMLGSLERQEFDQNLAVSALKLREDDSLRDFLLGQERNALTRLGIVTNDQNADNARATNNRNADETRKQNQAQFEATLTQRQKEFRQKGKRDTANIKLRAALTGKNQQRLQAMKDKGKKGKLPGLTDSENKKARQKLAEIEGLAHLYRAYVNSGHFTSTGEIEAAIRKRNPGISSLELRIARGRASGKPLGALERSSLAGMLPGGVIPEDW